MNKYSIPYLIFRGFHSLARNGFMTFASCIILTGCLFITGCLGLVFYNTYVNINDLDGLNEIVCMCDYDLPEGEEKIIEEKIKALENVQSVVFISKEDAFAEQIKQYSSFPNILNFFKDTQPDDTTAPTVDTQTPTEDPLPLTIEQRVENALASRSSLSSYTYNTKISTQLNGIAADITAKEQLIKQKDNYQHLSETYMADTTVEALYYKDGSLYAIVDGAALTGNVDQTDYLSHASENGMIMLYTVDFYNKFINYTASDENDGERIAMSGINSYVIVDFFNLKSVVGEQSKITVKSCNASVFLDKDGNITEEKFSAVINVVPADDENGFDISIDFAAALSDINSIDGITFDDTVLSAYTQDEKIADKLGIKHVVQSDKDETQSTDETTAQTDVNTDAVTTAGMSGINKDTFDKNPLSDAFKVVYNDIEGISKLRDELTAIDGIRTVEDAADAAKTLDTFKNVILLFFVLLMIVLVTISCIINVYTINMAITTRKDEILVMRYVGATGFFISFPFMFESAMIGLISSIVAYICQFAAYGYVSSMVIGSEQELASFVSVVPFSEIWLVVLVANILISVTTCLIGCKMSTKKHIKV